MADVKYWRNDWEGRVVTVNDPSPLVDSSGALQILDNTHLYLALGEYNAITNVDVTIYFEAGKDAAPLVKFWSIAENGKRTGITEPWTQRIRVKPYHRVYIMIAKTGTSLQFAWRFEKEESGATG